MKKLIFITLKILEVALIPAAYVLFCLIAKLELIIFNIRFIEPTSLFNWKYAFIGLINTIVLVMIYFIIELTEKIYKRLKK